MSTPMQSAPVLSTPDHHILTDIEPNLNIQTTQQLSEEEFRIRYEIDRTLSEIRINKWRRMALQFPDDLLPHSARVYQTLSRGMSLEGLTSGRKIHDQQTHVSENSVVEDGNHEQSAPTRFTILADTSYGSCCVDEIAAEHVSADAVIHYGRACLSPTARLPVIYIFTSMPLDLDQAKQAFVSTFPDPQTHVIITADIPYSTHIEPLTQALANSGYHNLFAATIIHDPSSPVPNRTVPHSVSEDPPSLSSWHVFHISEPPTALLLNLSSRVASIQVYAISSPDNSHSTKSIESNTAQLLRRRYALVTSMSTVSVWGILINTLSVKNYLHVVEHVKQQITNAGKKFYLFVVGKINSAKVANFSEIGGWVVIGCWESSLIDSKDFFRPILTPFELELALTSDDQRIWSGAWSSNFQELLDRDDSPATEIDTGHNEPVSDNTDKHSTEENEIGSNSEEESAPPEFDLRTGKLISRPGRATDRRRRGHKQDSINASGPAYSKALTRRAKGDIVSVNGVASPAGEYLKEHRTWKGLGSDIEIRYDEDEHTEGALVEQGRSGLARGYNVGDSVTR